MEELKDKWSKVIGDPLVVLDVRMINHKPHPFTIGPRHVGYAADHCGGLLGDEAIHAYSCAARRCRMSYEDHTYDPVMYIQLIRDATSLEVQAVLASCCDEIDADGIDGFMFVETEQKYRVIAGES